MPKLYFRYGTVGSAKTLNLLAVAHNYRQQNKRVLLVKPEIDTRFGRDIIKTRAGLEAEADILAPETGEINFPGLDAVVCVLVDEAQFLPPEAVDQLYNLAHACTYPPFGRSGIPVICYGLRTDFRQQLFPGSRRLLELADTIEEVKTVCNFCLQKATFNLKICAGQPVFSGASVELEGATAKYLPVCGSCYSAQYGQSIRKNTSCTQKKKKTLSASSATTTKQF